MTLDDDGRDRWAAYRTAVFELPPETPAPPWLAGPGPFGIITAFNPGRSLPPAENAIRHQSLFDAIAELTEAPRIVPIIGRSPDGRHRELSWASDCSRDEAVGLGIRFGQEAVFWIEQSRLRLLSCGADAVDEDLGPWSERLLATGTTEAP